MKKLIILFIFSTFLISCATAHYYPIVEGDCADRVIAIKDYLNEHGYDTRVKLGIVNLQFPIVEIADFKEKKGHAWVEYKKPSEDEWKRIDNLRSSKFFEDPFTKTYYNNE